jgi:hypothetical protein
MRTVGINNIQDNFVFVVGGKMYDFPRIRAEFLSPRGCVQHWIDPSITEYIVETNDVNGYFAIFKLLSQGSAIRVTWANRAFLLSLSREFCDSEVSVSILKHFHSSYPLSQVCIILAKSLFRFLLPNFTN